ncbi:MULTISPECIES: BON domain-containing protein [unclassified Sinorhizobium]|uniref:BON domain-containing protein n=1 Tax=unclassified Sinorhizobium TaxID=2613772 RepID=UPI00352319D1
MTNGYETRNNRYGSGSGRNTDRDYRGYGGRERGYADWDRYGSNRDIGRSRYDEPDRYFANDRDDWTTDDLGYSDYGYSDRGYRRAYADNSFDDRERGYARQYNFDRPYRGQRSQRDFMDRASDEVSSWFGDDQAARRREMDKFRGKGPKGYKRADERILEDVNDRLTDAPFLDASDIEVSVTGGEVTLGGFVSSRQDKRRAEDIVDDVFGVSHVQNNLRVRSGTENVGDLAT